MPRGSKPTYRQSTLHLFPLWIVLILGVCGIIVARFVSQSFDTRSRASIEGGTATITVGTGSTTLSPGKTELPIQVRVPQGLINGVQVVADIQGTVPADLAFTPSPPNGLTAALHTMTPEATGKTLSLVMVTTNPQSAFGSLGPFSIGTLSFTAPTSGEMVLTFRKSESKVVQSQTSADILSPPQTVTYTFVQPTPVPTSVPTAQPTASPVAMGKGYFTSAKELASVRQAYLRGEEPYVRRIDSMIGFAGSPTYWPYGAISGDLTAPTAGTCRSPQDSSGPDFLRYNQGARLVYAKVLAYIFTGNEEYAKSARSKILELTTTTSFGGSTYGGSNQCILELAFALPIWIQAADLLEQSPHWTNADKQQLTQWLSTGVYPKVAWASRVRANNWGAAGSVTAAMIADYVDGAVPTLSEVQPTAKTINPATAFREHVQQSKDRSTGVFQGDSSCAIWGIQSYGGIPDELRRGAAGCTATGITVDDASLSYQITHTDFVLLMAEFLWHRGDVSVYNQIAPSGKGSLKQALYFVINNPNNGAAIGWDPTHAPHLYLARRFYKDPVITQEAQTASDDARGIFIPFSHITHADINSLP